MDKSVRASESQSIFTKHFPKHKIPFNTFEIIAQAPMNLKTVDFHDKTLPQSLYIGCCLYNLLWISADHWKATYVCICGGGTMSNNTAVLKLNCLIHGSHKSAKSQDNLFDARIIIILLLQACFRITIMSIWKVMMTCWSKCELGPSLLNTLRPKQNGRHFADDTFKRIFLNQNVSISI